MIGDMSVEAVEEGGICPFCGIVVNFYGEGMIDCPNCGSELVNAEDDPADELDGDAVDNPGFDNDPDSLEDRESDES